MKAILFDMDGVLLDSEPLAFEMFRESLEKIGVQITLQELLDRYVGWYSEAIIQDILKRKNIEYPIEKFFKMHRSKGSFYVVSKKLEPIQGVVSLLEEIKKNDKIRLGVVSSTGSANVLTALNRMEVLSYFDVVICKEMVENKKPSPEGYLKAAAQLHCSPENCIVVEDTKIGIQAGKAAGMFVAGYKGLSYEQDTSDADLEVYSFEELLNSSVLKKFLEKC